VLDLYEELGAVVDALESHHLQYALCGGLAMAVHGFTRATVDIDLLVPADAVDAIESVVADLGYTVKALPMRFSDGAVQIRRVSKIDRSDGDTMMLDLLLVTPATEDVWAARQQLTWRDRPIVVVSREGLVALKRFRSSRQDLVDIERLESDE
jgi:hypothetical protein